MLKLLGVLVIAVSVSAKSPLDVQRYKRASSPDVGCHSDEFACSASDCIPDWWVCDGWDDCDGGADEQGCEGDEDGDGGDDEEEATTTTTTTTTEEEQEGDTLDDLVEHFRPDLKEEAVCDAAHQFRCDGDQCKPNSYRCDGFPDCQDGDDESGCHDHDFPSMHPDDDDDAVFHLPHGSHGLSDRLERLLRHLEQEHARFDWLGCDGGDVVIRRHRVCDGFQHCRDGTDEQGCGGDQGRGQLGSGAGAGGRQGGHHGVRPVVINVGWPYSVRGHPHHAGGHRYPNLAGRHQQHHGHRPLTADEKAQRQNQHRHP